MMQVCMYVCVCAVSRSATQFPNPAEGQLPTHEPTLDGESGGGSEGVRLELPYAKGLGSLGVGLGAI